MKLSVFYGIAYYSNCQGNPQLCVPDIEQSVFSIMANHNFDSLKYRVTVLTGAVIPSWDVGIETFESVGLKDQQALFITMDWDDSFHSANLMLICVESGWHLSRRMTWG